MTCSDQVKAMFDTVSIVAIIASLAAWLPPIAAAISIVWGCIRVYETVTVQTLLGRYHLLHRSRIISHEEKLYDDE